MALTVRGSGRASSAPAHGAAVPNHRRRPCLGSDTTELRLDGKVALVTGASRGIGRAIAGAMADAGASVMLSSRKADDLDAAVAEIGGETASYAANAGDPEAAAACVAATVERFGS